MTSANSTITSDDLASTAQGTDAIAEPVAGATAPLDQAKDLGIRALQFMGEHETATNNSFLALDAYSTYKDLRHAANIVKSVGGNAVKPIPVVGTLLNVGMGGASIALEEEGYRGARAIEQAVQVGTSVALTAGSIVVITTTGAVTLPAVLLGGAVAGTTYAVGETGELIMDTIKARDSAEKSLKVVASGDQLRMLNNFGQRLQSISYSHTKELQAAGLVAFADVNGYPKAAFENPDDKIVLKLETPEALQKLKGIVEGKISHYQKIIDEGEAKGGGVAHFFKNTWSVWTWNGPIIDKYTSDAISAKSNMAGEQGNLSVINEVIAQTERLKGMGHPLDKIMRAPVDKLPVKQGDLLPEPEPNSQLPPPQPKDFGKPSITAPQPAAVATTAKTPPQKSQASALGVGDTSALGELASKKGTLVGMGIGLASAAALANPLGLIFVPILAWLGNEFDKNNAVPDAPAPAVAAKPVQVTVPRKEEAAPPPVVVPKQIPQAVADKSEMNKVTVSR